MPAVNKAEFQSRSTYGRRNMEGRQPILVFHLVPLFVKRISPVAL